MTGMSAIGENPLGSEGFEQRFRFNNAVQRNVADWLRNRHTPPDVLTHYTSLEGALGIIKSASVWLFNARDLNDEQELDHAVAVIRNRLSNRPEVDIGIPMHVQERLLGATFVFCLSRAEERNEADKLSMWRAYGDNGDGIALLMRTAAIEAGARPAGTVGFKIGKVAYHSDEQDTLIDNIYQLFCDQCKEHKISEKDGSFALAEALWQIVPFFKHAAFEEEEEWRAVVHVQPNVYPNEAPKEMPFEWHGSRPYVQIRLEEQVDPRAGALSKLMYGVPGPFDSVLVGPCPNQKASAARVSSAMMKYGVAEVAFSSIPYRGRV